MKIEEIIQKGEGSTLEFKETIKAMDEILSTIIAFANMSGGHVIIGINNRTRHVIGVKDPLRDLEALTRKIHDTIEPRILPNITVIPYQNTYLISVEIYPSALRPHFIRSKGKEKSTYIRIGSTTRLADQSLLNVIERSTISKSFDEEICHETDCEEIVKSIAAQLWDPYRKLQQSDLVFLGKIVKKGKIGQPIIDDLDNMILKLLRFFGPLSTHQITSCVDRSRRSVINRLAGLVNKGQIIEIARSLNDPKKKYSLII